MCGIHAAEPGTAVPCSPAGDFFSVARAFQPEHRGTIPSLFRLSWWSLIRACGPLTPTPLPRSTGARGGIVGEPRTGVRGCCTFVARAFQPEICPFAALGEGESHAKPRRETQEG